MSYELEYFHPRIQKEIADWPKTIRMDYARLVELLLEFGADLKMPHSKAMGDGLFELRAKGKEGIGRAFFCFMKGKRIVILHTFIKKTQTTPQRELDKARQRMKEVINAKE
uniref:Phage-related protein n=1 Tax=Chlorobium chlorochromatii (strain CaD3) TaxID=340177 RepID=Q3ANY8_CHLCH